MSEKKKGVIGQRVRKWLRRWVRDTKLAIMGIGIVMRRPAYIAIAMAVFLFFAYFFSLFQDGTSTWNLLWSGISFGDKMGLLGGVWGRVLANFVDPWGIVLLVLAAFQGLNVALLVYNIRQKTSQEVTRSGIEAGGVGAVISLVILGCPACGTSLLAPFLTLILGSGAMALVGALGWVLTVVAMILLVYAARRLGYGAYLQTNKICRKRKSDVATD